MFNRLALFLIGFGLVIIGFTYMIMYLNLMAIGYTFIDYLCFILKRIECLLSFIGLGFILLSFYGKGDKYALHI